MMNKRVATISAQKTLWTSFFMAMGMSVVGGIAQFLSDGEALQGLFSTHPALLVLVPVFAMLAQFLRDYVKHS